MVLLKLKLETNKNYGNGFIKAKAGDKKIMEMVLSMPWLEVKTIMEMVLLKL